ncbi:MAG: UDP-N-acetylmuramate dehydrogenase [Solitalea-like symbiont of Tyrophagus putrescentiae]
MIIETNKDLLHLNTFRVKSVARRYVQIDNIDDVTDSAFIKELDEPFYIIGSASNVLFVSENVPKIIKINTKGIEVTEKTNHILIKAQGGESLHNLVKFCVDNYYGGMENLALIPGSVGACPVQNVGAYGLEVKDIIFNLEVFNTKTFKREILTNKECGFTYRGSIFKKKTNQYIIISVTFKLPKDYIPKIHYSSLEEYFKKLNIKEPNVHDIYNAICFIRSNKLPDVNVIGNAGSFFKNPIVTKSELANAIKIEPGLNYTHHDNKFKLSAASLIELGGLKSLEINKISTWHKQPLVLVNRGNLSGKEVFEFSSIIIKEIYKKFGIVLEREVNVV